MATFKNTADHQIDIPLLDLRVPAGETFEIPDEFAGQFETNPLFTASRVKHPDQVPDPGVVDAVTAPMTGQIPIPDAVPAPSF